MRNLDYEYIRLQQELDELVERGEMTAYEAGMEMERFRIDSGLDEHKRH